MVIITYLPDLGSYADRLAQLFSYVRTNSRVIVFYKAGDPRTLADVPNFEYVRLPRLAYYAAINVCIVSRLTKFKKVLILDWFHSLSSLYLLRKLTRCKDFYCYLPVIQDWGWVKRRLLGLQSYGIRYDLIRASAAINDVWSSHLADYVIVQSNALKKFYCQNYFLEDARVGVNYNQMSKWSVKASTASSEISRSLLVANIEPHKGVGDYLYLAKKHPNIEFHLVGRAKTKYGERILKAAGAHKNIIYHGVLDRAALRNVYQLTDVLFSLSISEGSPRVVSEYVNSGKAIIAYDLPGLDYLNELDNCYLIEPGNVAAAGSILDDLSHNGYARTKKPPAFSKSDLKELLNHEI